MDSQIELADMIFQLRSELSRAMWSGEHSDLRFRAESVELELTVGVERSTDPRVGIRFFVLDVAAGRQRAHTATQRLTLRLQPVHPDAPDQPAIVTGRSLPGED
ncbi:trypco2 family protein [Plantactinospora sp. WMMB782]|uniref:trypco2 family protein n=1 Tax=Plantactinospora sp. WMMB782 TaxID=3404121 RepID=UPI003B94B511